MKLILEILFTAKDWLHENIRRAEEHKIGDNPTCREKDDDHCLVAMLTAGKLHC